MSLNSKLNDLTIHDADINMETSSPRKAEGPTTPAQQHVFTFVTVYYKHGEWGTRVYDTLQEGLLDFVKRDSAASEREELVSLDEEELIDRLLVIGKERIDNQRGHGLVGIIQGPRFNHTDEPTVYLEMYYKHGEWALKEGYSSLLDNAMEYLERQWGEEEWNELSEEEQMEAALERSEDDVDKQRGWGVVETFPGTIYAMLD